MEELCYLQDVLVSYKVRTSSLTCHLYNEHTIGLISVCSSHITKSGYIGFHFVHAIFIALQKACVKSLFGNIFNSLFCFGPGGSGSQTKL